MLRTLLLLALGLCSASALTAQCALNVAVAEPNCESNGTQFAFRIQITGTTATARLVEDNREIALPFDEVLVFESARDTAHLTVEAVPDGPRRCSVRSVIAVPPPACAAIATCRVSLEPVTDDCGRPDSLTAIASGTPPLQYQWNTGETTASIAVSYFSHSVTVTDAVGCQTEVRQWISDESFRVFLELDGSPCSGEPAVFTPMVFDGQGPFTYRWSTGETTPSITIPTEGNYRVTVTDAQGCIGIGLRNYLPGLLGGSLDITGPRYLDCTGDPVTLQVRDPKPGYNYEWIIEDDTLSGSSIATTRAGQYRVYGTDPDFPNCQEQGETTLDISELSRIVAINPHCINATQSLRLFVATNTDFEWLLARTIWTRSGTTDTLLRTPREPGDYTASIRKGCDTVTVNVTLPDLDSIECTTFCGTVIEDDDRDCIDDGTVANWRNRMLFRSLETNLTYVVFVWEEGNFCAEVPPGAYEIEFLDQRLGLSTECDREVTRLTVTPTTPDGMILYATTQPVNVASPVISDLSQVEATPVGIKVFPNPTTGLLSFDFGELSVGPNDQLLLYDGLGRIAARRTLDRTPTAWNLADQPAGVYRVVVVGTDGLIKGRAKVILQ